jgi:hypothetical protein
MMMISSFNVDILDIASELTTRPVGARARDQLLGLLAEHDAIEIDFHERSLTPSFADECIGQLAAKLGLDDFRSRVKLLNLSASTRPLVRHVILTRCSASSN